MRLNKPLFALLFTLMSFSFLEAQTVSGTVYDENKDPLIGVTILIKGTTNGVITDLDGNYNLNISGVENPSLIFSYTGYKTKTISVGDRTLINVDMEEDLMQLGEVVVTAFGVKNNVKQLNYAVQSIGTEELQDTQQENVVNALAGKVAGVQITNSSGSAGSSSQILIRGLTSVSETRNNQPLFVVDGIPVDNSAPFGGGNRAMDFNMSDVESISVLKGGAAAALYGIEAANGVVLITTKTGKNGKIAVNLSNTVSLNQALRTPPRQDEYKQGSQGVFDEALTSSYGPPFIPSDVINDNIGNFLKTGVMNKTDIGISGGTEKFNTYASINYLTQSGIVPGEKYSRLGVLLKQNLNLSDKLQVGASVNIFRTDNARLGFGVMSNVYRWPLNDDMRNSMNPDGSIRRLLPPERVSPVNPYFQVENNPINDQINRVFATTSLSYNIIPGLDFTYRLGADVVDQFYTRLTVPGTFNEEYGGFIGETERSFYKINSIALLNYNKTFFERLNFSAMLGNNVQIDQGRNTSVSGGPFLIPTLFNLNNVASQNLIFSQNISRRRVIGTFGEIKLDFDGTYYLAVTSRADRSSTFDDFFVYNSISGGVNISEIIGPNDILTYMKIRGSFASIGKDPDPQSEVAVLEQFPGVNGGYKYDFFAGNPNLVPEFTNSTEIGFDSRLFNGKTRLDFSWYRMTSEDQIITSRISPTSGWIMLTFNAGGIQNDGFEIFTENEMYESNDITWNLGLNLSQNRTTLIDLPSFVSRLPVTSGQFISAARPASVVGSPLMGIEGSTYLRNENGDIVIDEFGYPRVGTYVTDENGNFVYDSDGVRLVDQQSSFIGNRQPDFIIGLTNRINYRNFQFSFMWDFRVGGDVLNAAKAVMVANGSSGYLEDYFNKKVTFKGVIEGENGAFTPNDQEVRLTQGYFTGRYASVGENFVEDASWTRLRYATIDYSMPNKFASMIGANSLSISLTGRNLFLFTKYSGGDPETNAQGAGVGGAGTAGVDYFNIPSVRGLDFNIKVTF